VEKPAFLRAADADQVAAAAATAGRRVLVAENYAYKPLTLTLCRRLEADEIGAVRMVRLSALKFQATPDWRGSPELAGGGALFEGGVHWINLLGWLGGEIVEARGFLPGTASGPAPDGARERSAVVVVRYAGGGVGTLHHSWEAPARLKGISLSQIVGERGTIVFESNGLFVLLNGRRKRVLLPGLRDIKGFRAMFDDFLSALAGGGATRMTLALARRDLAIVEAAYGT